ncbi:MAG TPA: triose-phosphate isomerase [Propionibacteriaceae bacterium]
MTRNVWVGTSWKMTKTLAEATDFVDQLNLASVPEGVQPFVLPAHTALATVRDRLHVDSPVLLGAQNAHWANEGAGTGEISMRMAADAGARIIEMGHSERRAAFGETDETVAAKAAAASAYGLIPLICVGEPESVRSDGQAEAFIEDQVRRALARLAVVEVEGALIAYEPIWAIGEHGRPASPTEIAPVMSLITDVVADLTDGSRARAVLYGGSVGPDNTAELLADPHTDGLFVGRAAWTASGYLDLLERAAASAAVSTPS